jgi:hypothetical protein
MEMSKPYLIKCNIEGKGGRLKLNMNNVTHYEAARDKEDGATRIFFTSGKEIIVAETVSEIDVLLGSREKGGTDFAGIHVERRRGSIGI